MICPGCLKNQDKEFCVKCRKELFDGNKVEAKLNFKSPYSETSESFIENTKKISISGVQVKYSVKLEDKKLTLTERGGQYILKPIPIGQFDNLDQTPANEHLTMQIARQIYKINTPPNALLFFIDDSPAYIVRRFDINPSGGKFQQEDFAQIAQMTSETDGQNYKYDLSYEEIATLIKKNIVTHKIEIEKFFRLLIFNYIFCNGDAHLKNFSVIRSLQGDYVLTPSYDLLNTKIHTPNEADMALTLSKESFTKSYEAIGFYTYNDFYLFGVQIGIKESRTIKIIKEFMEPYENMQTLIDNSFLTNTIKKIYYQYYLDRIGRLNMYQL